MNLLPQPIDLTKDSMDESLLLMRLGILPEAARFEEELHGGPGSNPGDQAPATTIAKDCFPNGKGLDHERDS